MRDARVRRLIVAVVVVGAALWLGTAGTDAVGPAVGDTSVPARAQPAVVTHVVDGDTIRVRIDAAGGALPVGEHRVRLLEIDSPEMDTVTGRPECGAAEATAFLRDRLPRGTTVALEADREDTDRFGRALRHVWTTDGQLVNQAVVATGNARAVLFAPNDRHWSAITAAQQAARADDAGIWAACATG